MKCLSSPALFIAVVGLLVQTAIVRAQTNVSAANQTTNTEPAAPAGLSKGASDVVKLFRAGKQENVLMFYARYSELDYKLSADDAIYLKRVGISTNVISTMMETDAERQKALAVRAGEDRYFATASAPAAVTPAPVAQQPKPVVDPAQSAPSVVYPDYSAYPNYYETFDNSDRPLLPRVSVGVGVGVGFGGGGYYRGYGGWRGGHFGGRR